MELVCKSSYTSSGKTTFQAAVLSLPHSRHFILVMHYIVRAFTILLFLMPASVFSQTHLTDIRPLLKSLTREQKIQLLEYMRHLGANMDGEIQHAYEQIAKTEQPKAIRFIESFKQVKKQEQLASVIWDRDTLFFSSIAEGTTLLDSFRVTNIGNTPYSITHTRTTCDCTVLYLPQHPVMPGETALLRVQFDSSEKLGTAIPAIILYDNSTPNKRHILYLKGDVVVRKKPQKYPWED
ncbi:MAG: DUF1573 domain-containing protein [Lewinellaceae bacterium]|nr:DUF1573 domain-containing protein [Lewinellaceae bacterium]